MFGCEWSFRSRNMCYRWMRSMDADTDDWTDDWEEWRWKKKCGKTGETEMGLYEYFLLLPCNAESQAVQDRHTCQAVSTIIEQ
jgi:hypothetical protein